MIKYKTTLHIIKQYLITYSENKLYNNSIAFKQRRSIQTT